MILNWHQITRDKHFSSILRLPNNPFMELDHSSGQSEMQFTHLIFNGNGYYFWSNFSVKRSTNRHKSIRHRIGGILKAITPTFSFLHFNISSNQKSLTVLEGHYSIFISDIRKWRVFRTVVSEFASSRHFSSSANQIILRLNASRPIFSSPQNSWQIMYNQLY